MREGLRSLILATRASHTLTQNADAIAEREDRMVGITKHEAAILERL